MIEQIQLFFKDPAKIMRLAVACFFGCAILTTYFLFTLPHDLVYQGGMIDSDRATPVYARLFSIVGLAFVACYAAIHFTRKSKKEIVVYLDKKVNGAGTSQNTEAHQRSADNLLDVNTLKEKITKASTQAEKRQTGLNAFCNQLHAGQGALYLKGAEDTTKLELAAGFALVLDEGEASPAYHLGEGLIGQVAASGKSLYLDELPEGYAARIASGLGEALPKYLFIFPLKHADQVVGVVEVATFEGLSEADRKQAETLGSILADVEAK